MSRSRRIKGFRAACGFAAAVAGLGLGPAAASAGVRSGAVSDGDDVRQSLNPPNMPDVEQVRVAYDEAGSITVTTRWYEDVRQRPSGHYATETRVIVGRVQGRACDYILAPEKNYFSASIGLTSATGRVAGYEGSLSATTATTGDGRETSATFTHAALANRDYQCVTGGTDTWVRSTASDPDSRYSSSCDCWYEYSHDDSDRWDTFFFDGFEPPPPPPPPPPAATPPPPAACADGRDNDGDFLTDRSDPGCLDDPARDTELDACADGLDNDGDGKIDAKTDPGCRGEKTRNSELDPKPRSSRFRLWATAVTGCRIDTEVEVLPDLEPAKLFPFVRVRVSVKGVSGRAKGYRRKRVLPLGESNGYRFSAVRPGRYVVSGYYPGDAYRLRSTVARRDVSVSLRTCGR